MCSYGRFNKKWVKVKLRIKKITTIGYKFAKIRPGLILVENKHVIKDRNMLA